MPTNQISSVAVFAMTVVTLTASIAEAQTRNLEPTFWSPSVGVFVGPEREVVWSATTTGRERPKRAIVDVAYMRNVNPRHALGVSWYFAMDEHTSSTGPVVRYRRWLTNERFLEIAVGTPLAASQSKLARGSVLGLVKVNVTRRLGVALRPDVRREDTLECGEIGCNPRAATYRTVLAGVEFAW